MKPSNNKIDMRLTPTGWLGSNTLRINKITSLRVNSKKLKYEEWHQSEYQSAAHLMTLWNHRLTYLEMIIWSREHFFTSLHHIDAFPSFVLVFQRGVCVCVRASWSQECWNKEETPRMNPEVPPDNWLLWLLTHSHTHTRVTWMTTASRRISVLCHCSRILRRRALSVGAAPRCEGPGMWGVPRGASAAGGRAGVRGPDGCRGNICSTSWPGLISGKAATHTGREKTEREKGILWV